MRKYIIVSFLSFLFIMSIYALNRENLSFILNANTTTEQTTGEMDREPGGRKIFDLYGADTMIWNAERYYVKIESDTKYNEIYAWGANIQKDLGVGDGENRNIPTLLPFDYSQDNILEIEPLFQQTFFRINDINNIYIAGTNSYGIGDGTTLNKVIETPSKVMYDQTIIDNAKSVRLGSFNNYIHMNDGTLYGSGYAIPGTLGSQKSYNITTMTKLSSSFNNIEILEVEANTVYGRDKDGNIVIIGHSGFGAAADGTVGEEKNGDYFEKHSYTTPRILKKEDGSNLNDIKKLSTSVHLVGDSRKFVAAAALDNDDNVWTWGLNDHGQAGLGHTNPVGYATMIPNIKARDIETGGTNRTIILPKDGQFLNSIGLDGKILGFGLNANYTLDGSQDETANIVTPILLTTGEQYSTSGYMEHVKYAKISHGSLAVYTNFDQVYIRGYNTGGQQGTNNPLNQPNKEFKKVIIPIKPIITGSSKLDIDNKEVVDDPNTTNIDESKYSNTVDENGKITKWDKYNSSVSLSVKREGMLKGNGTNETAIDYGDMKYEYCELEYNDQKEAVCKKDDDGNEIWKSDANNLISKRTAYPEVDDVELVDVNNTPDDLSDDVYQVKEHDITVDLNSAGSPQKAFRKYRFFYEEVRERYDTENSDFDPYSYYIVDLDRGDPEVHYLNLKENTNQEILDTDGTYMKLLDQQILRDEQYFGHGIRIYLPEHAKAYVVIEKTKNGKKQDETIPGFGDPVIPVLVEGQAPIAGVNFNDFFPQTVGNGYYRIYYINEYGNDVTLHFRISHDRDRPLILPNDNDSGGGDWKEELFNDAGDKIGVNQHYGGVYIVDMDTADPTKWDASTKTPVKNYKDVNGDMIYAIEGTQGTYTSDATPDRPKTIENNEVINHDWINHSLWLTVTGQDVMKTTSTLDSLRLYKLDEEGNRIQPADSVVNFDEGSVSQIKNNYAIPVKENGNYELVLQDFAGNENVSQGNEARGVFFTVDFIDTKAPVVKEPILVRDPKTNELNITIDADDGTDGSGIVHDDPSSNTYGIYYQFVKDGDDPTDTNWLPYVQDENDDDHILHVPSQNFIGKLYVKVSDYAGNIAGAYDSTNNFKKMISFDIADDSDVPVITYEGGNPTSWQNIDAVVSFKASDNIAIEKVELVSYPKEVVVDTFKPNYENKTYSECKTENHNCTINGNELDFTFTIDHNEAYRVNAYDMAGNKTTAIIDATKDELTKQNLIVSYIDKVKPTVNITRTTKGELKIIANDLLSGIKTSGSLNALVYDGIEYIIVKEQDSILWNDTSIHTRTDWSIYDPNKLADINTFACYVYVRISDQAGNQLIQKSALMEPTDLEPPVYVQSKEAQSITYRRGINNAVKVSVNFTDNFALKEIEVRVNPTSIQGGQLTDVNGTSISDYMKSDYKNTKDDWLDFYVKQSGDYQVRATDEQGNTSDWTDVEATMIDQIEPTLDVIVANGKFKVEHLNGTISDIAKVKNAQGQTIDDLAYQFVKDGDTVQDRDYIYVAQGQEVSIPKEFTGILYVRCYDEAKLQFNPSSKGNMKLVKKTFEQAEPSDQEPPLLVSTSGNPIKWTNKDALLTLNITDNESGVVRVSVKDQLSGMIIFNKTDFVKQTLQTTIRNVPIKTNGTYVVEMEDANGNVSDNALVANQIEVTKIDKRKPVIENISWVNAGNILFPSNDLKVDVSSYDEPKENNSSIVRFKYAFVKKGEAAPDPTNWDEVSVNDVNSLIKTNKDFVGKLVMRAIDAAGNESETITATVGESTGKDTKPVIEIVQGDHEPWLRSGDEMELIIRVKEPNYGITHIEVMDHASGLSSTYAPYDHSEPDFDWHEYKFKVTENGMYTIKAVNDNKDQATLAIYVSHFDTTAPILSSIEWIKGNSSAKIHASDPLPGSGLKTIYYQLVDQASKMDESKWKMMDASQKEIAIDENYKGSIYAKACDVVGNCSDINIQSLYLDQGTNETDRPIVELLDVNEQDQEEGTARFKTSDLTSGVKYVMLSGPGIVGESIIQIPEADKMSSEQTMTFNQNGTYTIIAYDYVGNASEPVQFIVKNLKEEQSYLQRCKIGEQLEVNVDSDGNGIPDLNLDPFGKGIPTINIDLNCDAIPDVNIDNNGDGYADLNIDHDDGIPYKNLVTLTEWKPNQDFTLTDGYHFETMTTIKANNDQTQGGGSDDGSVTPNPNGNSNDNHQTVTTGNQFTAPLLGSMANHPWWWILLLILSMITMRWGYRKAVVYVDERKMKRYLENHNDDRFYL